MNRSSKFNFFLPQNTDPIEVSDFNSNFETIDANLLTKAQSLTEAQKAAVRANADLNVANNLTTAAAGSVLDARQGKAVNDKILNSAYPVQVGTSVSTGTDFNTFTTPGIYTISQDAVVRDSANSPSIYGGKLCVYSHSGNPFTNAWQYGCQIYRDRVGDEYVRGVNSNASGVVSFGSWGKIAKTSDIPFYEEYLSSKTSFTFASRHGANESFIVLGASGTVAPFAILVSIGSNAVTVNKIIDTYGITFGVSLSGKNVTVTFSPAITTFVKVIG